MSETFRPRNADGTDKSVDARFLRLPSIAERKLGRDYSAPIRLDPRVLDQMQQTIRELGSKYAETLAAQVGLLPPLIQRACAGIAEARGQIYTIVHDVRGLAGTFGHPIVGSFAKSLCGYMESSSGLDPTIMRFHIEAMRDALEDPQPDAGLARETLRSLELLIDAAGDERSVG
ncbi:MAG TPA: hypothetical protein VGN05_15720 [Parvibaculum sp.]|jgi:hypothetical protein